MDTVERVGVIPRTVAIDLKLLDLGFSPLVDAQILFKIEAELLFLDRPVAEEDPTHKQIIPYGIVCQGDRVFLTERLTGGGEARLHGRLSLGVGGHVNPIDRSDSSAHRNCSATDEAGILIQTMERELHEELWLQGDYQLSPIGFINDDTDPVGRVHLGVVYQVSLTSNAEASVREQETLRGDFVPWTQLLTRMERMETWSAFVANHFPHGIIS